MIRRQLSIIKASVPVVEWISRYGFTLEEIQQIITLSDEKEISRLLRQQRDKLKREQQEKAAILNELQTHISIFERTGDVKENPGTRRKVIGMSVLGGSITGVCIGSYLLWS